MNETKNNQYDLSTLLRALKSALRFCPTCSGKGEYKFNIHLSPSEIDEIIASGKELPKSEVRSCLTCKKETRILHKYSVGG